MINQYGSINEKLLSQHNSDIKTFPTVPINGQVPIANQSNVFDLKKWSKMKDSTNSVDIN